MVMDRLFVFSTGSVLVYILIIIVLLEMNINVYKLIECLALLKWTKVGGSQF